MSPVPLFLGQEQACSYLAGRTSRMAYVPPDLPMDQQLFSRLVACGFRRSGDLVYRPYCQSCSDCIPVRIPVSLFKPNRSQRRVLKRNAAVRVIDKPDEFEIEHYHLYSRYLRQRHPDSGMVAVTPEEFLGFLANPRWEGTRFVEFRENERLLAVAVVDLLIDGVSAVYTFYEPSWQNRGLGTLAVLWQVEEARRRGLDWVYLGFWISGCEKMAYKSGFQPLQRLTPSGWRSFQEQ